MRKSLVIVALVAAVCTACASKSGNNATVATGSCVNNELYEQVKITIEHDVNRKARLIREVPTATVYYRMKPIPNHREKVCWVLEPVDSNGLPTNILYETVSIISKDGSIAFDNWTTKQRSAGTKLYIDSETASAEKKDGWEYMVQCGTVKLDPVIIIIDDGR